MTAALQDWLASRPEALRKGPLALILCEDDSLITETLTHHLKAGFGHVLALSPEPLHLTRLPSDRVTNLIWDTRRPDAHCGAVNAAIAALPEGSWLYYAYNAEFLFFPFSETRSVGEMLAFHAEERRDAMLSYVIDLYARDLAACPDAVSIEDAMFDATGYYALGRKDAAGQPLERQLNIHGGLRWRFEDMLPQARRRIDRIALFRSAKGLELLPEHRFNVEEYNTYACPWHHNLTAAIASFRAAKALTRNPASAARIDSFDWDGATRFEWRAQQLMDLGMIEPGQWF